MEKYFLYSHNFTEFQYCVPPWIDNYS